MLNQTIIYLDNHATTPIAPEVEQAICETLSSHFANPSSIHALGKRSLRVLEEARQIIAESIHAEPDEIIFTASGSESNNLCIKGFCEANGHKGRHLITSSIEHPSVSKTFQFLEQQGFNVTILPVDSEGFVTRESLESALRPDTILVSIMQGNHEIGTIQSLSELAALCENRNIAFHTDAAQSFLKTPLNVKALGISLASFSGHKIHAPKGIGFIYKRRDITLASQIEGGSQEFKLRAGTENTPYIVGLAKATTLFTPESLRHMRGLQEILLAEIREISGCRLNGPADLDRRLCNNINIAFSGLEGETLLNDLSELGIYLSTGSACSNRNTSFSPVLKAIQCPIEYIHGNLRLGLSRYSQKEDLMIFLNSLKRVIQRKKVLQPFTLIQGGQQFPNVALRTLKV